MMKIKLLIATDETDYAEHLSDSIARHHADVITVSVCLSQDRMREMLEAQKFDAALLEASFAEGMDLSRITLPILLAEEGRALPVTTAKLKWVKKFQRISTMVSDVLELYAKVSGSGWDPDREKALVTAVWSPAGGVGKTTVALAYATKKHSEGKEVLYLDLEPFSSVPAYFDEMGKSISAVFEMLDNNEGNIKILIRGLRRQDNGGVSYFCHPDNFDDMNVLSAENISALIKACAGVTEELVIDMSCVCDDRTRQVFKLADRILLVIDPANVSHFKLSQFTSQHEVFDSIKDKAIIVANKDAAVRESLTEEITFLPLVHTTDPTAVYRTLSSYISA